MSVNNNYAEQTKFKEWKTKHFGKRLLTNHNLEAWQMINKQILLFLEAQKDEQFK